MKSTKRLFLFAAAAIISVLAGVSSLPAQTLIASDGDVGDRFGWSVSLSGAAGLVGARNSDGIRDRTGAAYVFRELDSASGTVTESAKLIVSNGTVDATFGESASLSGDTGLVGAFAREAAYVFRGLDVATGTITESATLIASDNEEFDSFGGEVSLAGNIGIVGATGADFNATGAAYVFRGLDVATGTVSESAKLVASTRDNNDVFGSAVSLSGTTGLIGASGDDDNGQRAGTAYIFRDLDSVSGIASESAQLLASDGDDGDSFGSSVSLFGSVGLVGARATSNLRGSAYLFRGLDVATGIVNESAKLVASDGDTGDLFGWDVSFSEGTGLIGSLSDDENGFRAGSAYIFHDLDSVSGNVTETVKLLASDGRQEDTFGYSVSLEGDRFSIGAAGFAVAKTPGTVYTGKVSSMTTLDAGNAHRIIDGISFKSRVNWIIGQFTSGNQVVLTVGDSGEVLHGDSSVQIGANAGSNDNTLTIAGQFSANAVYVGADGNSGNRLIFDATADLIIGEITLFDDNCLLLEGEFDSFDSLQSQLFGTDIFTLVDGTSELVTAANFNQFLSSSFDSATGYTTFKAVPEPSAVVALLGSTLCLLGLVRRRRRR